MAQRISPLQPTIDAWLNTIEVDDPCLSFRDRWLRCHALMQNELTLKSIARPHLGTSGYVLETHISSFDRLVGSFFCVVRPGLGEIPLSISAPMFTRETPSELVRALLISLWKIAPAGTRLEVKLEDDIAAEQSPLAVAERYTDAGWTLQPADTQLISEQPRIWIFCFKKIC